LCHRDTTLAGRATRHPREKPHGTRPVEHVVEISTVRGCIHLRIFRGCGPDIVLAAKSATDRRGFRGNADEGATRQELRLPTGREIFGEHHDEAGRHLVDEHHYRVGERDRPRGGRFFLHELLRTRLQFHNSANESIRRPGEFPERCRPADTRDVVTIDPELRDIGVAWRQDGSVRRQPRDPDRQILHTWETEIARQMRADCRHGDSMELREKHVAPRYGYHIDKRGALQICPVRVCQECPGPAGIRRNRRLHGGGNFTQHGDPIEQRSARSRR